MRLVYPAHCGVCRGLLEIEEKYLCLGCAHELSSVKLDVTDQPLPNPGPYLRQGWSLYTYKSPVGDILSAVKFSRKWWLLDLFDASLEEFLRDEFIDRHYDFLMPIPLDSAKRTLRQFNQSEILAKKIARATGMKLKTTLLTKRHATPAQSLLGKKEREANLFGAFYVRGGAKITGKKILLVDDVYTTGATSREAARTLKAAGARHVDLLSLARTEER